MKGDTRDRLLLPVLLPLGILAVVAVLVVAFSRVLLSLSKEAATGTAVVVAGGILAVAAAAAKLPPTRRYSNLLAMVAAVVGVAMLAGGIALATVGKPEEGGGGAGGATVVELAAPVGASVSGFDATELSFPADTRVVLRFDNQDTGVPHNVVVTDGEDPATAEQLLRGDLVTGPGTMDYEIEPLAAGTYYFHCELHPTTMTGKIVVGAGATGVPSTTAPSPTGGAAGAITVTAQGVVFDTNSITLPAGGAVTIHFVNNDGGIPHNISIYTADPVQDPSAKSVLKGELITGPATIDYTFDAPPAGTYDFQCDVHPTTMNGTVTVQ